MKNVKSKMFNVLNKTTIMKKTYITPEQNILHLDTQELCIVISGDSGDGTQLVKESGDWDIFGNKGETTSSSDSYNVWDDDWSK